jgi:DNA replication protein DnaC
MTPQLDRLTVLCKQLNLLHSPTQIAHLGQMAAKRELCYLDFLEHALKDGAMTRTERMRRMLTVSPASRRLRRLIISISSSDSAYPNR